MPFVAAARAACETGGKRFRFFRLRRWTGHWWTPGLSPECRICRRCTAASSLVRTPAPSNPDSRPTKTRPPGQDRESPCLRMTDGSVGRGPASPRSTEAPEGSEMQAVGKARIAPCRRSTSTFSKPATAAVGQTRAGGTAPQTPRLNAGGGALGMSRAAGQSERPT